MRILTVRQPWAYALAAGLKDVENRDFATPYRGPVAVHAGINPDVEARARYPELFDRVPITEILITGHIVAVVDLVDIVRDSSSPWAQPDKFHWVVANPRTLDTAIPYRGSLGLQHLPPAVAATVEHEVEAGR